MSGNLSVRRAYWATQETVTDWTPTATNSAGGFDIATDGSLVCGVRTKTATLLFTTTDLWSAVYIGQPFYFSFRKEGTNCGILSQRAFVLLDQGAYWMGFGRFHRYDGFVQTIPCDVTDYVFGNFKQSLANLVWAVANTAFNEITWYYPSASATTHTDRYVTYNYVEDHWVFGNLDRACGVARIPGAALTGPVLIDSSGNIYDHETGSSHSGAATPSIESGPLETGNGDRVMRVQRIIPDDKTLGDVQATLYASFYPDQTESTNGPFSLADPTSVRITARQLRIKIQEVTATAWRLGVLRIGIVLAGRR